MGIERVEGPYEGVGGIDRGVELVQQQGKAVGLVAVEAMVTA